MTKIGFTGTRHGISEEQFKEFKKIIKSKQLDEFHHGIDNIILKYPILFGFTGLMTSAILILLSIISLIS